MSKADEKILENEIKKQEVAMLELSLKDAKALLDLYKNVELADTHFKSCQSENFRLHVRGTYQAKKIVNAFQKLQTMIDNLEQK